MNDRHNRADTERQEPEGLYAVVDARFSWRSVEPRASSERRHLTIAVLLIAFVVILVVCASRFLLSLDFACTSDNRGRTTCFFFYRQSLPQGCPPDCGGTDLSRANLSGADLSRADLSEAILSRTEL